MIYKQKTFSCKGRKTALPKPLKVKVNLLSKKGIAVVTWDRKDEFQIHCLKMVLAFMSSVVLTNYIVYIKKS